MDTVKQELAKQGLKEPIIKFQGPETGEWCAGSMVVAESCKAAWAALRVTVAQASPDEVEMHSGRVKSQA